MRDPYPPIENFAIVGDLYSVALVGMDGSIDFMCLPHFDSPSIFARLLDHEKGGFFQIAPVLNHAHHRQLYLPDTNVLLTRFLEEQGVGEVSDFMTISETESRHRLVRRAKTVRGEINFRMTLSPRFDYARASHKIEQRKDETIFISEGADGTVLRLVTTVPVEIRNGDACAEFTLRAGETASFVLEYVKDGQESPAHDPDYVSYAFKETLNYWRQWIGRCTYRGRWREEVNRSALALKLLVSRKHGSLVAAPTFGLPEAMGGQRNWDYRYTWIRDASFTLYALIRLGFTEETADFMKWIEARCAETNDDGSLQIMYGICGRHDLPETELTHLEGYRGSKPVRIGNGACNQLQLDIYGELLDAVYLCDKYAMPISHDLWTNLVRLLNWVCENWQRADEGIWEVRGGRKHFTLSRVMCWVALDRGIRLARKRSLPLPSDRWFKERDIIYKDVFDNFWKEEMQAFVQHQGSATVDASCLLMPLVRFISPVDPRWLSTLKAIDERLVEDSMVHRYRIGDAAPDGLPGKEGTFSMCTFWFSECLSRAGNVEQARFTFEKMLGYANHVGLYAEQLGARGEHLGNTPQAFTHIGLISAAYDINRRLGE